MRVNVDGSNVMELFKANNASALTLDQNTGYVYWAVGRQIHSVHIDGSNKFVLHIFFNFLVVLSLIFHYHA